MPGEIVDAVEADLTSKGDREDLLRGIFFSARNHMQTEISDLLADFRCKRSLGKYVSV